jgi:hypothetical protein
VGRGTLEGRWTLPVVNRELLRQEIGYREAARQAGKRLLTGAGKTLRYLADLGSTLSGEDQNRPGEQARAEASSLLGLENER